MVSPTICSIRFVPVLALFVLLVGCATGREDVQDIGFWALGWQLKAVQNRVEPAFPPVLRYLRPGKPEVRPAEPPAALAKELHKALFGGGDPTQKRLERRLIGVFTVTGYGCAADGFAVRDRAVPVAGFVVFDTGKVEGETALWSTCDDLILPDDRVAALRRLIVGALDRADVPG